MANLRRSAITPRRLRLTAIVSIGVLIGAAGGIRGAIAGSSSAATSSTSSSPPWPNIPPIGQRLGNIGTQIDQRLARVRSRLQALSNQIDALGIAGPAVHEDLVVPSSGGGFETVNIDSGTLKAVSGSALTFDEGYSGKTYRTVTLTIPSGASVERNFSGANLSDLKVGDHVSVARSPKGTRVSARDAQHRWP
jgi:hypothetical protein